MQWNGIAGVGRDLKIAAADEEVDGDMVVALQMLQSGVDVVEGAVRAALHRNLHDGARGGGAGGDAAPTASACPSLLAHALVPPRLAAATNHVGLSLLFRHQHSSNRAVAVILKLWFFGFL